MKKTILLTGGAGFIGANFVNNVAFYQKDFDFVVLDALTYAGDKKRIEGTLKDPRFEFVHADIRDAKAVNVLFARKEFAGVIHFAAESHVDRSIENPNIFVETNVLGTMNLLNASLLRHQKQKDFCFLHISTDEVYGSLKEGDPAFTEKTPLHPNSPYSASKAASDLLAVSFHETYGLPVVMTRCCNNYGPFQAEEKLIPLMIKRASAGEKLPVYGDGRNIREWIHVEDHNRAVWAVYTKGRSGEVYNIGTGQEVRNIEMVEFILGELGKPRELISFVKDRLGHDFRYAIDSTKLRTELGWAPVYRDWRQGLRETIKFFTAK